jgi:hypothetical protein
MTPLIGTLIADAATSAIRGLGSGQIPVLLRPNDWPAPVPRKGGEPVVIDLYLIKIEINFGR